METLSLPQPITSRQVGHFGQTKPAYSHHNDMHPSLSWGFLVYAVRWHLHRMTQAEMARLLGGGIKQEYISRWERGVAPVPQTVRTFLVQLILTRLNDGLEIELPKNIRQPSRNDRQQTLMHQHGNFGGKGKKRRKAA